MDITDEKAVEELHRYLDGKYQGCIAEWGKSMWNYSKDNGFDYYLMGNDVMIDNLNQMKPKLEAYALGWNMSKKSSPSSSTTTPNVNVTVNNEINISITFEQIREKIEDMTSLTDEQAKKPWTKFRKSNRLSMAKAVRKPSGKRLSQSSHGWQIRVLIWL